MTDIQKKAVWVINQALRNKDLDDDEYLTLLEAILQPKQYVPYPIEMPNPLAYPWVTYQSTCKADIK